MEFDLSVCRVCLKADTECVDLRVKVEYKNEYSYLDIFNSCTNLNARFDDKLPNNICNNCSNDLFTSFEFLNRAISSDQYLRSVIGKEEEEVQYYVDTDEEKEKYAEEVQVNDLSDVETNAITFYEENPEIQNESNCNTSYNTFEVVELGSTVYEDDTVSGEEYEQHVDQAADTELSIECLTSTNMSRKTKKPTGQGNETIECEVCGKMLKRWSLQHHLKRCHKKEKIHLCSACSKTFTTPGDLKIHMKTHDKSRERNYICTICRKGFFEKQSLGVHMLRHTGIKEHECSVCQKKFTTKKSLEVHQFTHNRQSGRFVCRYCEKRFPSKADLTVHERFHTGDYPYQCEICDKSYAVKSHYNYHMGKHKGVTYKCDQCDKEFMNRGSLTAHKFKHSDKMPHECPICKKGFSSPFKLNRHQNCHKSKDEDEVPIDE